MRTLIDRLFLVAIVLLSAALILVHLTPAFAHIPPVPPDHSFAGSTLGLKDPTSKDVANAVWWLFKGIVITFVVFVALRNRWVRDWLTSPEYNEATGLRRRYIEDGGGPVESKAKMSVGEAIYMIGVFAIDALLTLGVAALIFYAVVS